MKAISPVSTKQRHVSKEKDKCSQQQYVCTNRIASQKRGADETPNEFEKEMENKNTSTNEDEKGKIFLK